MTVTEAINHRISRRKYLATPMSAEQLAKLSGLIEQYSEEENIRFELVSECESAFDGLSKSYGMFNGVNSCIALIKTGDDPTAVERLGYYGELLVLHATAMNLGTCWVAGTFSKKDLPLEITENEELMCLITIGNVPEKNSLKEKFFRGVTHRKSKTAQEMYTADKTPPAWFLAGMEAVVKAPSAVNKQPVMFSFKDGEVAAKVGDLSKTYSALDFGIAKLHFQFGAGGGSWAWGIGGTYTK
ncbi:MAG: nitroreductase [Oscillospiraceae bacterium]|nr:nitroreductase [Oscillospiraceae bacterium]